MTDVTRLTALLDDYAGALDGHLRHVREEFDQLHRAWRALSDVYEGNAADQFRTVFEASAARMTAYDHDANGLLRVLRDGIAHLRDFDTPARGL
jgi:uncharacterized protein YukE